MSWTKSPKTQHQSFAILALFVIALLMPALAFGQKEKGGSGGGGGSAPHNTAPPPPSNHSGGGGASNTNTGGSGGHPGGSNTGGSSGTFGNKGGTTGTTNNGTFGSHNSNPYGEYGKAGGSTGTTGGSKSNPYGEYGNSSKGGSNPYGSYGSKSPTGTGSAAGGAGGKGGSSVYGSYGSKGATSAGGNGGINGGNKGGTNSGGFNGTKGATNNGGINAGNKGGINNGGKAGAGGISAGVKGSTNNGGKGEFGGAGGKGGSSVMSAKGGGPPPGGKSITRSNGDRVDFNKSGTRTGLVTKGGTAARFDSHGRVSSIHTHDMTINRAGRGRTVITERADHSRLVSMGRGRGYSERGYSRGGHEFRSRTYFYHGRYYARAYRGYYWHGYRYYGYVPGYWYSPGFYGWAYNPWATPIAYGWGWGGAPWYGYYGYYFTPYPVYPSAAFWLTDYLMAQSLQAAYEAGQESARLGGGEMVLAADQQSVVLTPEVKKQISDEVAAIIAQEKNAAANSNANSGNGDVTPDALDPNHRIFIVASALSENTADGTSCSLSQGDVLTRIDDTPDADHNVKVSVTASQKDDCAKGSQVSVSMDDLQEMHNHLREQVDDGLSALSKNQGKGGLPSGPAGNPQANPDGQAQPDTNVGNDLQQQQQSADQAEKDVQQSAGADNGA